MKIGSMTICWNAEQFIKSNLEMLSGLDCNVVFMQKGPWPDYIKQHGVSIKPDRTREIIKKYFPKVEVYESRTDPAEGSRGDDLNQMLEKLRGRVDYAVRLDTDMFFTKSDFDRLISFVKNNSYDCYRLDFASCSVNYNGIGNFDHGLMDAVEVDPIVVNVQGEFGWLKDHYYPPSKKEMDYLIHWEGFMCHHFRGWKPKVKVDTTGTYKCPNEIKDAITSWQTKLYENLLLC